MLLPVDHDDGVADAAGGERLRLRTVENVAGHGEDLSGTRISHGLGKLLPVQAAPDIHFLIELVAANSGNVIAPRVEEQRIQIGSGALHRGRLARTQAAIDLKQAFLPGLAGITLNGGKDTLVFPKKLLDLRVGLHPKGTDQAGDRKLAVLIDPDIEAVLQIRLVFQPGAAVRDNRRGIDVLLGLVHGVSVIHAGAADDLGNDDALRAVDHEGAAVRHQREIAHENLLVLDFAGLLVVQADANLDGLCISCVAFLAFFDGVLRLLVKRIVKEGQFQIARVIGDRRDVVEYLAQPLVQEPVVGILLNLQEVRHLKNFLILGIAFALCLPVLHVLDLHMGHHSLSVLIGCVICSNSDTHGGVDCLFLLPLACRRLLCYNNTAKWEECAQPYSRSIGHYFIILFSIRQRFFCMNI